MRLAPLVLFALLCAGCSTGSGLSSSQGPRRSLPDLASARTVGRGPRFRPDPTGALVARAEPVDGMRCVSPGRVVSASHLELFAAAHVVVIPAGIGIAPPFSSHGAYVTRGRCAYPMRTLAPTGVVLMETRPNVTLGRLFDLWGQPLTHRRVAGFAAPAGTRVSVFIDGARWRGDPSSAPVAPGAQIAIEVGPHVTPHPRYTLPPLQSAVWGASACLPLCARVALRAMGDIRTRIRGLLLREKLWVTGPRS
jgi:hypothetical protein